MGSRKKWYRLTYVQSRNRVPDVENKLMDTKGGRGVGRIGKLGLTYTHIYDIYLFYV